MSQPIIINGLEIMDCPPLTPQPCEIMMCNRLEQSSAAVGYLRTDSIILEADDRLAMVRLGNEPRRLGSLNLTDYLYLSSQRQVSDRDEHKVTDTLPVDEHAFAFRSTLYAAWKRGFYNQLAHLSLLEIANLTLTSGLP